MDIVDRETRSRMMARIRGANTAPERKVRSYLHGHGFRFRLHRQDLPGRPDIVLPKYHLAILVHGCFWHRHEGCPLSTTPMTNRARWQEKFASNIERDQLNIAALRRQGWRVVVIWECGLRRASTSELEWLPDWIRHGGGYLEWPRPEDG